MKKVLAASLVAYFKFWSRIALKINHPTIIGITGSVGKSSARNTIDAMLKDHFPTYCLEKGNSQIGLPLGILGLEVQSLGFQTIWISIFDYARMILCAPLGIFHLHKYRFLIVEMGIDSPFPPNNMEYLLTIVKPDISIFLNVFPTHTEEFDKVIGNTGAIDLRLQLIQEKIAEEKGKIITQSGCHIAIYNSDNVFVKKIVEDFERKNKNIEFLSFGESSANQISCNLYKIDENGTSFVLKNNVEEFQLYIYKYLLPKEYAEIFGCAVLLGTKLGLSISEIVKSIESNFHLPAGRSTLLKGVNNSIIIDSSYNASKAAVIAFLDMMSTLKDTLLCPTVFIFGDMRELGKESQEEHEEVVKKILEVVDYVYCVGPMTKEFVMPQIQGKVKEAKWFPNSVEAGQYLAQNMPKNALVLAKGSQNTIYIEEAVKQVLSNKEDVQLLCRQSGYWMDKKNLN